MHLHRIRIRFSIAVQVQLYLDCESNRYLCSYLVVLERVKTIRRASLINLPYDSK
jgi:hypothetical protein